VRENRSRTNPQADWNITSPKPPEYRGKGGVLLETRLKPMNKCYSTTYERKARAKKETDGGNRKDI